MNVADRGARRWRPSAFLQASALVHAGAAATALAQPTLWPWALGAFAANHALIAGAGLWPRSQWLGSNWTRLPDDAAARGEVAITIDDGPDPNVTPKVLNVLRQHGGQASFFCIGQQAQQHPDLCRAIVAAGHRIENHSQRHRHNFSLLGLASMRAEISAAQDSLEALTGRRPQFFRAPAGLRNPFLDPALVALDLQLASWTRRAYDTRNGDAADVLRRLTQGLAAGDILLLHDRHAAHTHSGTAVILEVLPRLLDVLAARNLKPVFLSRTK